MKFLKTSKGLRLIAFFLVAVILICAFGFSADGWHIKDSTPTPPVNSPSKDDIEASLPTDGSQSANDTEEKKEEIITPKFYNSLTGEETTEELSKARHIAFVMNPAAPMYGVSSADVVIEFPIEDGTTRLLSFINTPKEIVKIGSLSKSRGYITNLAKALGATVFSCGNDDTVKYDKCEINESLTNEDTVKNYVYTEFARFTYTSGTLVTNAMSSLKTETHEERVFFQFAPPDASVKGNTVFNKIKIPHSSLSETALVYSSDNQTYSFDKNGTASGDLINGNSLNFKNCFVLFADSTTYELQDSTQMILNTIGSGSGYYFTEGTAKQISWSLSKEGVLTLYDESSNELIINPGKSYFSFVKSSKINDIVLS